MSTELSLSSLTHSQRERQRQRQRQKERHETEREEREREGLLLTYSRSLLAENCAAGLLRNCLIDMRSGRRRSANNYR